MMKTFRKFVFSFFFLSIPVFYCLPVYSDDPVQIVLHEPYDHSIWNRFLQEFVNQKGQVDYRGVKENPELLDAYLKQLEGLVLSQVDLWPREEQIALWLNVYHAIAVKVITEHYPVKSILDIPGAFEKKIVLIGNRRFSLNDVHREELIGGFSDEKIHFAVSCTAKTCPPFPQKAYEGPTVEGELYLAAKAFINNDFFTEIIPEKRRVRISKIFEWHHLDFILDFGRPEEVKGFTHTEEAMLAFVAYYLDDLSKIEFLESRNYKLKYLPFDWSLNEWKRDGSSGTKTAGQS